MATKTKRKSVVLAAESVYISPLDCDSTVSYKIVDGARRVWGSVQLADCNRKIEWSFFDDSLPKISKAIAVLEQFRDRLTQAQTDRKKRTPRVRRTPVSK